MRTLRRHLSHHLKSFAGTSIALALGVALISATLLVFASATPQVPPRLAATEVLVQSPVAGSGAESHPDFVPWSAGTTQSLVDRLRGVPGVADAIADRTFYAQAIVDGAPAATTEGHGFGSAGLSGYRLGVGREPGHDGEIVVDGRWGIAPGAKVTVLTAAGPTEFTVSGTLDGRGVYVTDAMARRLAGGATVIGLRLGPGADPSTVAADARAATGTDGTVLSGRARSALEPLTDARTRWLGTQLLTAMVALAGFVSVFVVASTFGYRVMQRRRELGLLRAIGATPNQVRRMLLREAVLVALFAGGTGGLLGTLAARPFGALLVRGGFEPPDFEVAIRWWPIVAAIGTGLVVALLGVWSASRRAGRIGPLEALREAAVERRPMTLGRWIAGIAGTALGLILVALAGANDGEDTMTYALYAAMALITGLTLLAPVVIPPVVRLVSLPANRIRGATGMLVREGTLVAVRRTASMAAPVLATVGFAVLVAGFAATSAAAFATEQAARVPADAVVVPDRTPGLSDAVLATLPPGSPSMLGSVVYGGTGAVRLEAAGLTPEALPLVGWQDPLDGAAILVHRGTAAGLGWKPGDAVPLTFRDGTTAELTVAGLLDELDAPAELVLTRETVRAHDPSALTSMAFVTGATPAALDPLLAGLGADAVDVDTYAGMADAEEFRLMAIFVSVLIGLSLGYTVIAIVNTMVMATADRRSELHALWLAGATRAQALRVVMLDALLVVGVGAGLGTAVAMTALLGVRSGLESAIGAPVDLVVPWPVVLAVVGGCAVAAVAAAFGTARLVLRRSASASAAPANALIAGG